jgi:Xaa-Pro aminopeptidase
MAVLSLQVGSHRLRALREAMVSHRLDAVAVLSAPHFEFLANYLLDVEPWERPILAVFPREGEPFGLMNEISLNGVRMAKERGSFWLPEISFYSEHPRLTNRLPVVSQLPEVVAGLLPAHGLRHARIGVDATPAWFEQAVGRLPGIELLRVEAELRALRWVKTDEELALLRDLAALTDWVQERYRENVRPGRFGQELDAYTAWQAAEEACRRFPGEEITLHVSTLSGPDAVAPNGTGRQTGAVVEKGHSIVNIVVVRGNGLVVENERMWVCGEPSERQRDAFEVARRAQEAAVAQLVAGNPVCSVDAAAQRVFEEAGYGEHVIHRTGHGMGTLGHEYPEDMAFNTRALIAGEVYSAEPGIYLWGLGGFRHDDTVVVGRDQPEVLTTTPKDLEHQVIPVAREAGR